MNGEGQSPDPQLLLEQFLIQYRWHSNLDHRDGFTTRLAEAVQESNKTFVSTLNTWRNTKLERVINDCQSQDDRHGIRQILPREFREQFRKTQPGETESTRGIWLTRLLQVGPTITEQLKQDIDNFLAALLTPGNEKFSLRSGRNWLDALQTDLNSYQRQLEEEITNFGGMRKQEDLENKWRDAEEIIEGIEQKWELPIVGIKNRQVQGEAKRVVRVVCDLIKHNFDLVVTQEALRMVGVLQTHVLDRSTQVAGFNRLTNNLKSDYEKEESDLRQLNFDEMSGEAIFDNKDIEECYKTLLPEQDSRSQLVLVSKEITQVSGVEDSIGYLMDRTAQLPLQNEIDLAVDKLFGSRSTQIVQSVIKRFIQNYSIQQDRSTRLGDIRQEAEPLLRLNLRDPYFSNSEAKRSDLVGFKHTDESEVHQFKNTLKDDLSISENVLKPTQAEDEILIVTEYAGFPLRLISGLEQMRNIYIRENNSQSSFLHNDCRTRFTDIIPPDALIMEELEDIFYPCLAFRLISNNANSQQLEFSYYDELRDCHYNAEISSVWNQALEELANRRDMTDALKESLDVEIARIEKNNKLWKDDYLPKLRNFVDLVDKLPDNDPNYPYKATVVGVPGTTEMPAKEGIINRFLKRIDERFKGLQNPKTSPPGIGYSHEVLPAEIVDEHTDSVDNRAKRRQELESLKQDVNDGIITDREYEKLRQDILNKYPI